MNLAIFIAGYVVQVFLLAVWQWTKFASVRLITNARSNVFGRKTNERKSVPSNCAVASAVASLIGSRRLQSLVTGRRVSRVANKWFIKVEELAACFIELAKSYRLR